MPEIVLLNPDSSPAGNNIMGCNSVQGITGCVNTALIANANFIRVTLFLKTFTDFIKCRKYRILNSIM
jgi:hypothetical protein